MDDVVPSTSSAAVGKSTKDETTCGTRDKEASLHSSKTKMKTKINFKTDKQLNLASGSTIIHSKRTKNECNKNTNKTDDQAYITAQKAYNTNVIGTGASYTGGGIKNTFHGVSYQMKLAMLYIVRGLQQNCQFQVATEVEEAGKLDDLLFLYEDNAIGFFQAKHRLNENLLINEKQLLSNDDDFSISKYFHSYLRILNNKKLRYLLKDRDMTLFLNTNIGIDSSIFTSFELTTASSRFSDNKIVTMGTEIERANYYIINKCSTLYNKLFGLLLKPEQPSSARVAENLAKAVVNNKKKSIKIDDLFDRYWEWLLANVLDDSIEVSKTQQRYFVTFKDSFLSASESSLLDFQKTFLDTYLLNKHIGKKDTTIVQEELSGVKFEIPKRFGSKIKTIITRQDEVRTFLDLLVFAVNQRNETILGNIIEEEISDYVGHMDRQSIACKFKLYIQDWAKQREGRYLTNKDIERQFALWGQETLNQIRMDDVKKYKCTFVENNKVIKSLSNFLKNENDTNVICLYCREMLFSNIKVCHTLQSFTSKNIDQRFIFCDIKDLIELENTKKCPVKAFSSQTCNLLFITFQEGKLHSTEVLHRLLQIVIESNCKAKKPHSVKRLIFGIPEKEKSEFVEKFCFNNLGIKTVSLDDFDNCFSELDEKSRRQLMEKGCIKLHGNNITGVLSENELSLYMRDEMLLKLISSELEINDAVATNHYYNEEVKQYYVNRSLVPVIVSQNITEDPRFHFVREDTPQRNVKNQEVVVITLDEKLFEQFRKTNVVVHWLKETNREYIWVTSQGNISNLRKYVATQDSDSCRKPENYIPITNVSDLRDDLVLISASPGMGKSILLSHIAEQSKKDVNSFFVFKTNLAGNLEELDSLKDEENITLKQVIHFVFIAMQMESPQIEESQSAFNLLIVQEDESITFSRNAQFSHLDHLRAMVFCNMYNKEKIVLLLDGFDEIAPDYCKTALNLLQMLKHSKVHKMWVTTRPYGIIRNLENELVTFAYALKPLSEDYQLTLIKKFWRHKINFRHTEKLSYMNNFFKSLDMSTLSTLHKAEANQKPNDRSKSFMSVPLHCYMLAKVLINDFLKFCSQNNDIFVDFNVFELPLTIFDLYSNFFNIKFDEILYNINLKDPKNRIFRERKKETETDHGKLALLEIFDEKLLTELVSDEDRVKLLTFVKSGNEKLGFVEEVVDNRPRFVHRTFAEYFAAHYMAKIILSPVENKRKEAAKSLLYNSITVSPQYYNVLFTFFNYIVVSNSKNKDIFEAAIAGNIRKLSNIENVNEMFDPLNRTPMHLITYNFFNVLKNFINAYRTAELTTVTSMYNNDHIFIHRLCQSLIKLSTDILFTWTPTHYLALGPFEYFNILDKIPIAIQYFDNVIQDTLGRTPLMLLILRYSLPTRDSWIKQGSRLNFTLKCVNSQDFFLKTALHYALENFKKYISSHEENRIEDWQYFLEIICFLLKNGARINIPDNQGITPVDMINSLVTEKSEDMMKRMNNYCKSLIRDCDCDNFFIYLNYVTEHVDKDVCNALSFEVDEFKTPDHMGRTALPYAVKQKKNNAVINLILACVRSDIADGGECCIKSNIKGLLKFSLLKQILENYNNPFLPVANSKALTIFFISMLSHKTANSIIETTDLLALFSKNNDHKNIFIFLSNWKMNNSQILLSKFPHLVDVLDSRGRTALHYAINSENRSLVISLINNNSRIDIPDNTGKIPAHFNKSILYLRKFQRHQKSQITIHYTRTLRFINKLPYQVAKRLVLTMALFPPLTPFDYELLNIILHRFHTIAAVLWAEHSDFLRTASLKENCSYFDCIKASCEVARKFLKVHCVEDFSDNALESNDILKSVVDLFSSVKNNYLSRVVTVLKRVETYCVQRPNLATVNFPFKDVEKVADVVNARSKDGGKTALHYVAETGNAEIAQCLLSHGAWYNVPDFYGCTPAQVAKTQANTAVLHLLEKVEVLFICLNNKEYDFAQSFVTEENIDSNVFYSICFKTKKSLMHLAVEQHHLFFLNWLVKRHFESDFFQHIPVPIS